MRLVAGMRKKLGIAIAGSLAVAAVVAALGFGVPSVVQAQTATPPASGTQGITPQTGMNQAGQRMSPAAYLAKALGINVTDLRAAELKAYNAEVDAAVKAGNITQSQADQLKNGIGRLRLPLGISSADREKMLADALNITVADLQSAEKSAQQAELAQAVANGRITQAQADLISARQALQKYIADKGLFASAVAAAVKDGVLTQAQADAILNQANSAGGGPGFFKFGGRGFAVPGFGPKLGGPDGRALGGGRGGMRIGPRGFFGGQGGLRIGPGGFGGQGGMRGGRGGFGGQGGAAPASPSPTVTPNA